MTAGLHPRMQASWEEDSAEGGPGVMGGGTAAVGLHSLMQASREEDSAEGGPGGSGRVCISG